MSTPHKLTFDDLWSTRMMGQIALAPDGRSVVFELHSSDKVKNATSCALFLLPLDVQGHALAAPRQLTGGLMHDTCPVWSPDSRRLLFLSDREEHKNQLWLIDIAGGEARRLTSLLHGVSEAAWSPDGQWIAFTASAAPLDNLDLLTGRKPLDEEVRKLSAEEQRLRARSVTSVLYRLDGRGLLEKFTQLFVMPAPALDGSGCDPAQIRRLTSMPIDHDQLAWTPDSAEISVLCNIHENRDRTFVSDLWLVNRETAEARCLTEGDLEIACYSWSPDGQAALLVAAKDFITTGYDIPRLYLVTRKGNVGDKTLLLCPDFALEALPVPGGGSYGAPGPYRPQWSQDGQQAFLLASDRDSVHVYCLDIVWRTLTLLTDNKSSTRFIALLPEGRGLLLAQENADHPWELYHLPLSDTRSQPQQLTHVYAATLSELLLAKTERLVYRGAGDVEIDGWLVHPLGARAGVRYPLLVRVHGGPHGAYGPSLNLLDHYFATQGYAVFYCNPHGSTGRGLDFARAVIGDWGGQDFEDIMLGVDACIARGIADPERLVLTGSSYGGYMTMFMVGHTNRFKAAVPIAGISNLASFVGTSDIGFWQVGEAQGYPWDEACATYYRERSPLTCAPAVTTPTLLIHSENDLRCPIEQSEQFYMALKMLGKAPVEFVRVPAAWHTGVEKPALNFIYWEKMLAWFSRYIKICPAEYN